MILWALEKKNRFLLLAIFIQNISQYNYVDRLDWEQIRYLKKKVIFGLIEAEILPFLESATCQKFV